MAGDIFDGHASAKLKGIALKHSGVTVSGIGKLQANLSYQLAGGTPYPLDRQNNPYGFIANRKAAEPTFNFSSTNHLPAAADGASNMVGSHFHGKENMTIDVISTEVTIATKAESMVQKAGGHEGLLFSGCFGEHPVET
jgi:hypothetical protein